MTTSPVLSITDELLAELEQKAKAATPGQWHQGTDLRQIEAVNGTIICHVSGSSFGGSTQDDAAYIAAANPATIDALVEHIRSLAGRLEKAESASQPTDDELAERMKASGMLTVEQMMAGAPLDAFTRHAGVVDIPSFLQWIEMRRKEVMSMQARRTLDKREDDDLFEWIIAHAAVFSEVHVNLKAALAQQPAPVAWFTEDHLTDKSATTYAPEVAERWRAKGWPVSQLYAAPATAEQPDAVKVSRALLDELAGDLAAEVEARYTDKDHPALKHKYERDMRPALEARALLDGGDKP